MSWSSAATSSRSGRRTVRISDAGLGAGLHDVAVDGEAVDRRGVRQQPDLLPLGQEPVERPGLVERLPHRQQARPAGEQSDERVAGRGRPRHGEVCALAHETGRGGRREDDVAAGRLGRGAQQQGRVVVGTGAPRRAPPRRATARCRGRSARSAGVRRSRSPEGRAITASVRRHARRERWAMRRPRERTWRWAASASARPEPLGERSPHLRGDPVAGAAGDRRAARRGRRAASCRAASSAGVDASTSQLASIALSTPASRRPALGLLEVGHRGVGELADRRRGA